jgi:membrane-associated phospholipid phosphatase
MAGLALLAYAAYSVGSVESLDLRIFLHLRYEVALAYGPAEVAVHLGDLGPLLAWMAVVTGLGVFFGRRREVVAALAVIVGANLTTQVLKITLEHPRNVAHAGDTVPWWNSLPQPDAFPSGHTTAVAAVAVALLFVVPSRQRMNAAAVGILLTGAMATAVVVLGWHYPTDAIGAVLVAAAWGFFMVATLRLSIRRPDAESDNAPTSQSRLAASGD